MNSSFISKKQHKKLFAQLTLLALTFLPLCSNSKSESTLNSNNNKQSNIILSTDNNQNLKLNETQKKQNSHSCIKFLDSNSIIRNKNQENENEIKNKKDSESKSCLNQINLESRLLQSTSPTGTQNNNTSTGVPTPITTANASSTLKSNSTVFIFPKCLSDSDCSGNGVCDLVSGKCACNKNFISIYDNKTATIAKLVDYNITYYDYSAQKSCNYAQKKQLTAFMLSIFVGFGAEHFYLGRTGIGIAKLVFYVFCGFLNVLYLILYKCVPGGEKYVSFIHTYEALYLGCGVGYMLLWNIFDWVNIGFNDLHDGNNIPLSPWGL